MFKIYVLKELFRVYQEFLARNSKVERNELPINYIQFICELLQKTAIREIISSPYLAYYNSGKEVTISADSGSYGLEPVFLSSRIG